MFKGDATLLKGKMFDTILANINKNILLRDMPIYFNSLETNGNLVISGFFETDINELVKRAEELGLKLEGKQVSNTWATVHFIK